MPAVCSSKSLKLWQYVDNYCDTFSLFLFPHVRHIHPDLMVALRFILSVAATHVCKAERDTAVLLPSDKFSES